MPTPPDEYKRPLLSAVGSYVVQARDLARDIQHWQPGDGLHKSLSIPEQADLEVHEAFDLSRITCAPAQREQYSKGGAWWDSVMFGFHGEHRNGDPRYHRKMEQQLKKDPSKLPPIMLMETEPGSYEIVDGWHRASIARSAGLTHLTAGVYTMQLQAQYELLHPRRPSMWHSAPSSLREQILKDGIPANEMVFTDRGYAETWRHADMDIDETAYDLWELFITEEEVSPESDALDARRRLKAPVTAQDTELSVDGLAAWDRSQRI